MFARFLLLAGIAAVLPAAPARNDKSSPGDVTVHEWGTFTTVAGPGGQPQIWQPIGGPEELPCFVRRMQFQNSPKSMFGTVRMETPVLYFYSPQPAALSVKVGFPKGLITEWYPDAAVKPFPLDVTSTAPNNGSIAWQSVRVNPAATPVLPVEKSPNHYYAARETDAAPVAVNEQWERFLFYRGIGRFEIPFDVTLSGEDQVTLRANPFLPSGLGWASKAILFENRGGRLGFREIEPRTATVTLPSLDASLPDLTARLETILVNEGLFEREAHAMVETWKDSWFQPGTRLFYVVPRPLVDDVLPLRIDPAPAAVQRVFVGRIELLPPWIGREAKRAIQADDVAAVKSWGRFWGPIMEHYPAMWSAKEQGPEVRRYLQTASTLVPKACVAE